MVPVIMRRRGFKYCKIFPELFKFEISKNRLPAVNYSRGVTNIALVNPVFSDFEGRERVLQNSENGLPVINSDSPL